MLTLYAIFPSQQEDLQHVIQEEEDDNHQGGTRHRGERDL